MVLDSYAQPSSFRHLIAVRPVHRKEPEAQRNGVTFLRPHSIEVRIWDWDLGS